MPIKPFNEYAQCVKCMSKDVAAIYHPYRYGIACAKEATGEHLCRVCRRCGYQWTEACVCVPTPEQDHLEVVEQLIKAYRDRILQVIEATTVYTGNAVCRLVEQTSLWAK